jgi:hypothetical protein
MWLANDDVTMVDEGGQGFILFQLTINMAFKIPHGNCEVCGVWSFLNG